MLKLALGDFEPDGDWLADFDALALALGLKDGDGETLALGLTLREGEPEGLTLGTGTSTVMYGAGQGVPSALRPLPVVALTVMFHVTSAFMTVSAATETKLLLLDVPASQAMMRRASKLRSPRQVITERSAPGRVWSMARYRPEKWRYQSRPRSASRRQSST